MSDVTRILSQIEQGDLGAAEQLLPLVYSELHKLAASRLAQERPGQTLQATAIVSLRGIWIWSLRFVTPLGKTWKRTLPGEFTFVITMTDV